MISVLKISGKNYSIEERPAHDMQLQGGGYILYRTQEIIVLKTAHREDKLDTVLHEAIHAIDYNGQLELSERQVHALASALYAFIRENPEFIQEILNGEKI